MTRLEVLKAEKEQIKSLHCLSFGLIDKCIEWYDKEIEAIVIHGADNKFYGQQAKAQEDADLISRQEKPDGDAVSRIQTSYYVKSYIHEIITESGVDKNRHTNEVLRKVADGIMTELPSAAIPQEHDGCKDCKYEDYPEYYYPCCECNHNYKDMWKKKPHWNHGVCDNCGYDWGKDAPITSVPKFCPNCGCPMEIER